MPSKLKKSPDRFFMVCRDPKEVKYNNPKSILPTMEAARTHAEKLAKDLGQRFYVLASVAYVEPTTPPVEWTVIE